LKNFLQLGAIALAVACLSGVAAAETVTISGASTVFNVVVKPTQDKVIKSSGHTLEITTSNTGKGLIDLVEGRANLAMVSEPMDIALDAAAGAGKKIDAKTVQFFEVRKDEVVFAVHPSNPVAKLTWDQIRDIHTGKIKNWKDVGGKDLAIVVYTENPTGGTRALIRKIVMGGADFSADAKPQTSVKRVAEMVAGDEAGIGGVGRGFANEAKDKVVDTKKIERPLGFATLGAPSVAAKAVIDAFVQEAKAL
jgi:phosphate transport system substrate-binding protein